MVPGCNESETPVKEKSEKCSSVRGERSQLPGRVVLLAAVLGEIFLGGFTGA